MNIENKRDGCWYAKVCQNLCTTSCIRYQEMKFLIDKAEIPIEKQKPAKLVVYEKKDLENFKELGKIKANIEDFILDGKNLYLCSESPGTGKTTSAIKLMLKYFDLIWSGNGFRVRGVFVHVPTFLSRLKNFSHPLSEEYRNNVLESNLVIWDDIAAGKTSEYDYSQLLSFIDYRLSNGKSNIYTSNIVNKNELDELLGGRLSSRIFNESKIIKFNGKDYRQIKNYEENLK